MDWEISNEANASTRCLGMPLRLPKQDRSKSYPYPKVFGGVVRCLPFIIRVAQRKDAGGKRKQAEENPGLSCKY